MKTKHLFLATALMASFAACTNEEIVSDVQQNVATGRPTVENVKLTFGENVESRLIYANQTWKWEATDKIGALLMDEPGAEWGNAKAEWDDKYTLSQYIHTSYPFSYNSADKTWGTPGKMLEGNYFFAYPWESYEGQRKVAHSLVNQKQTGITADVRAKSYADNQFFIGYDRIIAGTQDVEALNNVSMTSILGAIELRIVNTGTQTYNINKVVLSGDKLASKLTFNPADVNPEAAVEKFNTANYLDYDNEEIYTADDIEDYDKNEALRAVVTAVKDAENDFFAQLNIDGERTLLPNAKNTAYVLLMANPFEVESGDKLTLSIYTDEGMVTGIDLTEIAKQAYQYGYITDAKIKKVHPLEKNVITIQLDDNVIKTPEEMVVYNTQDLEQLIEWNANVSGVRDVVVTLAKNATLTKKAYDAFVAKKNMSLTINYPEARSVAEKPVLTLAEGLPANIFENEDLDINTNVEALCDIELTEDCTGIDEDATITVAKGAELTIDDAFAENCNISSYGKLTMGANAHVKKGTFNNYGEMTVAKEAIMTKDSKVNNYGKLTVNGYIKEITENGNEDLTEEENAAAVIKVGANGNVSVTTNYGKIVTEGELDVTTNDADAVIEYEGGEISIATNSGKSIAKISGTIDEEDIEDYMSEINTWVVSADVTFDDDENALSFETLEVKGGADVTVEEETSVTITKMVIEGTSTIEGAMTVTTLNVEEAAKLTVDEDAVISTTTINNEGVVKNNGTVKVTTLNTEEGDWRGNEAEEYDADTTDMNEAKAEYITALSEVIKDWVNYSNTGYALHVQSVDYNLNRAEVKVNNTVTVKSAKNVFIEYYEASKSWTSYGTANHSALIEKYEAYVDAAEDIEVDTDEWAITDEYAAAVTQMLNIYKGELSLDETKDPIDSFTPLKKALTWTAPTTLAEGMARIYKDVRTGEGTSAVTTSAETLAKKAFFEAVITDEVKNNGDELTQMQKAMIITNGENNAPAGSQVFLTDNIYKVFNATNGIGQLSDWRGIAGLSAANGAFGYFTSYETVNDLSSGGWNAEKIQTWVNAVAVYNVGSGTEVIEATNAKAFVRDNGDAIYNEAKTWNCYSEFVIKAIIADYNGWVLTEAGVTIPTL